MCSTEVFVCRKSERRAGESERGELQSDRKMKNGGWKREVEKIEPITQKQDSTT